VRTFSRTKSVIWHLLQELIANSLDRAEAIGRHRGKLGDN